MRTLGQEPQVAVPSRSEPAVAVRRSVRPDHLVCLVCGKGQKLLKRHLAVKHELAPNRYRETFGLKPDYPMTAPNYAKQRRELALSFGLERTKKPMRDGSGRPQVPHHPAARPSRHERWRQLDWSVPHGEASA